MSAPVFPMFLGSGRSGTTLFRNIFDAHPDLAMSHEAHFVAPLAKQRHRYQGQDGFAVAPFVSDLFANPNFVRQGLERSDVEKVLGDRPPGSFTEAVRTVFSLYATQQGKTLYGDKTPGYVNSIPLLGALFPEAKFVHIIRDGRDVALGYLDRPEWGPSTIGDAAHYWEGRVMRGRTAGQALEPGRYLEAKYEDMVNNPEKTTRTVAEFLGLEYHDAMLRYHESGAEFIAQSNTPDAFEGLAKPVTKGMRDWRSQMDKDDIALFEAIAGDVLSSLEYERTTTAFDLATRTKAVGAAVAWQAKRAESRLGPALRGLRARFERTG